MSLQRIWLLVLVGVAMTAFAAVLNNGAINVQLNGDGPVGKLFFRVSESNHMNDCSLRINYAGALQQTVNVSTDAEKEYAAFDMLTGYGRDTLSNFYVVNVSYLDGTNSALEQIMFVLSRQNLLTWFGWYMDANVLQTETNDTGYFAGLGANDTVTLGEADVNVGLTARLQGQRSSSYVLANPTTVLGQMQNMMLSNTKVQDWSDMAAAVAWAPLTTTPTPLDLRAKLIAATTQGGVMDQAPLSSDTPVGMVKQIDVKKAKFIQKFRKQYKDMLMIKGSFDISQFQGELDNLSALDVSFFVGDYLAFTPDDGSAVKVRARTNKRKLKTLTGTNKLKLKTKKSRLLKFTFKAKKTDLQPATLLNDQTPDIAKQTILLPVVMVLTGVDPNDMVKGGKVWVMGQSVPFTYTVRSGKKAKGKD
jgi:hypothetical protein